MVVLMRVNTLNIALNAFTLYVTFMSTEICRVWRRWWILVAMCNSACSVLQKFAWAAKDGTVHDSTML